MMRQLSGLTKNSETFDDDEFNDDQFLKYLIEIDDPIPIGFYFAFKLKALFVLGFHEKAFKLKKEAEQRIGATWGQFVSAEHCFFHFLTVARRFNNARRGEKLRHRRDLKKKLKIMKKWASFCQGNFKHKQLLMEAEMARIGGKSSDALRLYEEAETSAREAGFPLNETLSCELAGRFEQEQGRKDKAAVWLQKARDSYKKWGAHAKVKAMDEEFKTLLGP